MLGISLCAAALAVCFLLGRRGLAAGLCGVFAVGYFNGILRANYLDAASNFIFDSACIGFYAAHFFGRSKKHESTRSAIVRSWLVPLIGWPALLACVPLQDYLVQLVGLRGNVFFVPFLYFGALLTMRDWDRISIWVSILNLAALGFALAEYFRGIEAFFPINAVTEIIYLSRDLEGFSAYRIPATFLSAHAYGGTMALTIPILFAGLLRARSLLVKILLGAGMFSVVAGVLMCAARSPFIVMALILGVAVFALRRRLVILIGVGLVVGVIFYFATGNVRLERFRTLADSEFVEGRIGESVNASMIDAIVRYPLGNGIGGGGTSMPYFLQGRVRSDIEVESEYARLQLELGLPGLLLWIGFVGFSLLRHQPGGALGEPELARLVRTTVAVMAVTGFIGTGLFTSIPSSALLFCYLGWLNRIEPLRQPAADGLPWPAPGPPLILSRKDVSLGT